MYQPQKAMRQDQSLSCTRIAAPAPVCVTRSAGPDVLAEIVTLPGKTGDNAVEGAAILSTVQISVLVESQSLNL